ncbi:MAG: HD domain-containing protein [Sphaerochaetaceae bacterium]|nr:HD domain-containing protein [Sphaerochaetaceae bacterium]
MEEKKLSPFQELLLRYAEKINQLKLSKSVSPEFAITTDEKLCAVIVMLHDIGTGRISEDVLKAEIPSGEVDLLVSPSSYFVAVVRPSMISMNEDDRVTIIAEESTFRVGDITTATEMPRVLSALKPILDQYRKEYDRHKPAEVSSSQNTTKAFPK